MKARHIRSKRARCILKAATTRIWQVTVVPKGMRKISDFPTRESTAVRGFCALTGKGRGQIRVRPQKCDLSEFHPETPSRRDERDPSRLASAMLANDLRSTFRKEAGFDLVLSGTQR